MPEADPSHLPSRRDDHTLLRDAVREAAGAVLDRFHSRSAKSWKKGDSSPVSEADIEANDILRHRLMAGPRATYGWLSEESVDEPQRLTAPRTWIIDPIDGTRAFLEGRPEFTVCAALMVGDQIDASVIFNPVTDEFFDAVRGGGARCNGEPMSASRTCTLDGCSILAWRGLFQRPEWPTPWPEIRTGYRNSTSYRMALVARGDVDAAIALVPKADWDVAMGTLMASEAGACASDHHGTAYRFNQARAVQRALVCAAPDLYPSLIARLGHLPGELRPTL